MNVLFPEHLWTTASKFQGDKKNCCTYDGVLLKLKTQDYAKQIG